MKSKLKKIGALLFVGTIALCLSACNAAKDNVNTKEQAKTTSQTNAQISVISREDGSGTRTAFTEITKVMSKDSSGKEVDNTSSEAVIQNSTNAVMTSVASDNNAIGYISLGSLNDTVKALKIEGQEPNSKNVKSGQYKIARNFNIVYKSDIKEEVKDFLKYIESDEGQKIVEASGYIPEMAGKAYKSINSKAQITIAGSTSVAPLMEKLVEGYKQLNKDFNADIQATGSSAGIKSAQEGSADIGMSSRELKDSEKGIQKDIIARDGIAVIVNKENKVDDLTMEQTKNIFEGKLKDWSELNAK